MIASHLVCIINSLHIFIVEFHKNSPRIFIVEFHNRGTRHSNTGTSAFVIASDMVHSVTVVGRQEENISLVMPHCCEYLVFLKHQVLSLLPFSSLVHPRRQTYSVLVYSCSCICFFSASKPVISAMEEKNVKIQVEIFSKDRCCQHRDHIMTKSLFSSISSNCRRYPLFASQAHHTFMPHFTGFTGMYRLRILLPLKGTIASSILIACLGF